MCHKDANSYGEARNSNRNFNITQFIYLFYRKFKGIQFIYLPQIMEDFLINVASDNGGLLEIDCAPQIALTY